MFPHLATVRFNWAFYPPSDSDHDCWRKSYSHHRDGVFIESVWNGWWCHWSRSFKHNIFCPFYSSHIIIAVVSKNSSHHSVQWSRLKQVEVKPVFLTLPVAILDCNRKSGFFVVVFFLKIKKATLFSFPLLELKSKEIKSPIAELSPQHPDPHWALSMETSRSNISTLVANCWIAIVAGQPHAAFGMLMRCVNVT